MKTLLLVSIIVCLGIFSAIFEVEAIPWTSEEGKALDADAMAVGRIISYQDDGAHRYYEISIIKWIKNPQANQTITMGSITPKAFNTHIPYTIFAKKDLGLFYLKSVDGKWQSTNYSRQILASEISDIIYNMKKLVGNNNPDSSISLERTCKEGYVNAVKNRTGEIFCVKPQTLQKLRERGWAESSEFYGLTESQVLTIKQTKFTCAKVIDPDQCMKQLEHRKAFFREQNLKEPSNKFHAEINGLKSNYEKMEPIEFSTNINLDGNDCFTLIISIDGAKYDPDGIDDLSTWMVCPEDSEIKEFTDDFKFNTKEKIRVLEKGEYRLVISAHYYKDIKILAEKKFSIN